jgi:hypothetical protein
LLELHREVVGVERGEAKIVLLGEVGRPFDDSSRALEKINRYQDMGNLDHDDLLGSSAVPSKTIGTRLR